MEAERILLWGFMAAGKSEVGAAVAELLGWRHIDVDAEIEREQGRSIASIFADPGEAEFRKLEMSVSRRYLPDRHVVVSTGGGWVTNPEAFEAIPEGSLTVWLQVSPSEMLRRVSEQKGGAVRPMLRAADPRKRIEQLLRLREPLYARADLAIRTDGREVPELAREIAAEARSFTRSRRKASSIENAEGD